ncbi:cobyric acid synthase [Nocardioides piscis]|uniref:Cobyric acid synthase n=1 Tax=Nocardioides piscis TaxID=2714938 RepID=A0A6G7YI16_9ACTN|nr:cobyric acid synthase [Nocardioides piscis]QIK76452.1 cobyric acid synthase [Nocardioides piscis]
MSGALLVCGATSGAGKSTVTSALCRTWSDAGRDVAPFKAQNMSNHAAVTADGGEIGRAQAMQAVAARVAPDRRMNPILLKPSAERTSHLVVLGDELSLTDAAGYGEVSRGLRDVVLDAFTSLRAEHDWVVAEGAGGAAEINLLDRDLVNLPLAAAAGMPAIVLVDIDRGGAFASAYGTWALLPDHLRRQVRGFVFNQFRGDASLLDSGHAELTDRTGLPVLGVLPHLGHHPMLGLEDSLDLAATTRPVTSPSPLRVAVVRLPHLANPSDFDPLVMEPSVSLRWATHPDDVEDADLVILPGSRTTVADLAWARERGLADAVARTDAAVLGICAGYQMLGRWIDDPIESGSGRVSGLALLDVETTFATPKIVRRTGSGYEIRWGRPTGGDPWDARVEGSRRGSVHGTSVHGLFDDDSFRHSFLGEVARSRGRRYVPSPVPFDTAVDEHLDHLAAWLGDHLDLAAVDEIATSALPASEAPGWFR